MQSCCRSCIIKIGYATNTVPAFHCYSATLFKPALGPALTFESERSLTLYSLSTYYHLRQLLGYASPSLSTTAHRVWQTLSPPDRPPHPLCISAQGLGLDPSARPSNSGPI